MSAIRILREAKSVDVPDVVTALSKGRARTRTAKTLLNSDHTNLDTRET